MKSAHKSVDFKWCFKYCSMNLFAVKIEKYFCTFFARLSGIVCAYHPAAPSLSPKHAIYASSFIVFVLYLSSEKNENKQKEAGFGPFFLKKYLLALIVLAATDKNCHLWKKCWNTFCSLRIDVPKRHQFFCFTEICLQKPFLYFFALFLLRSRDGIRTLRRHRDCSSFPVQAIFLHM